MTSNRTGTTILFLGWLETRFWCASRLQKCHETRDCRTEWLGNSREVYQARDQNRHPRPMNVLGFFRLPELGTNDSNAFIYSCDPLRGGGWYRSWSFPRSTSGSENTSLLHFERAPNHFSQHQLGGIASLLVSILGHELFIDIRRSCGNALILAWENMSPGRNCFA